MRKPWLLTVVLAGLLASALFAHGLHQHQDLSAGFGHATGSHRRTWSGASNSSEAKLAACTQCAACAFLKTFQSPETAHSQLIAPDNKTLLHTVSPCAVRPSTIPAAFHSRAPPAAAA